MKPAKKPHGEIRQSQLITTFGPGSMLDLPNYSVLVAGLEFWSVHDHTLAEIWLESPGFQAFRGTDWMREPCRSCAMREQDFGVALQFGNYRG